MRQSLRRRREKTRESETQGASANQPNVNERDRSASTAHHPLLHLSLRSERIQPASVDTRSSPTCPKAERVSNGVPRDDRAPVAAARKPSRAAVGAYVLPS